MGQGQAWKTRGESEGSHLSALPSSTSRISARMAISAFTKRSSSACMEAAPLMSATPDAAALSSKSCGHMNPSYTAHCQTAIRPRCKCNLRSELPLLATAIARERGSPTQSLDQERALHSLTPLVRGRELERQVCCHTSCKQPCSGSARQTCIRPPA